MSAAWDETTIICSTCEEELHYHIDSEGALWVDTCRACLEEAKHDAAHAAKEVMRAKINIGWPI